MSAPTEPRYFNRELGLLKFNKRVLFQAKDPRNPLLERIRFLNIFHSNMDEFFMKRVGGLKRHVIAKVPSLSQDGLSAEDQLRMIRSEVLSINSSIDDLIGEELVEALKRENILLLNWAELESSEQEWARRFFKEKIFPVLTPMAVDPGHPFPLISNLSTSLAVSLQVPGEEDLLFARVKIPDIFPAWIMIPNREGQVGFRFVSAVEIVAQHVSELFPRMQVQKMLAFRITRNVDLRADEEGSEDLLEAIEEEVKQRRFAEVVRLEHGPEADPWLLNFLIEELELGPDDVYEYPLHLEFKNLSAIASLNLPQLKFKSWNPVTPAPLMDESQNIFSVIRNSDLLMHHPYESFSSSVERFIRSAAIDPDVVALKMTLYRTSEESPIVHSLIRAAEEGKQVVCLVELKARFDEERNIYWAHAMEEAGVHVVYGVVGLKTHAKIALVVRRERDEFRTYAHVGTGNYHPQTARVYTDFGLLTARPEITNELVEVFHYLTGRSLKTDYDKLLVAPINMKSSFIKRIENEATNQLAGRPARIIAKCNSLQDPEIIEALYKASQAGVRIDLIIRGFSCLRPQVPGLSENIRLISLVGPFLEHSRVFYFRNGQEQELDGDFLMGSADWMTRNLHGRVEVVAPVIERPGREKIWEALQVMLADQRLSWDFDADGAYRLRQPTLPQDEAGTHETLMERTRQRQIATRLFESESPSQMPN